MTRDREEVGVGGINRRDPRERASERERGYQGRVWEVRREPMEVDMIMLFYD